VARAQRQQRRPQRRLARVGAGISSSPRHILCHISFAFTEPQGAHMVSINAMSIRCATLRMLCHLTKHATQVDQANQTYLTLSGGSPSTSGWPWATLWCSQR